MKPDGLRLLGWAIPILCMAVACWILFKEHQDFIASDMARNQANRDLEVAAKENQAISEQPPGRRYAAVDDLPEEEIAFLTYLRTRCAANNVNFKSWSSQTVVYGKDKEVTSKDEKTAALLKGIRKISASLTLAGPYANIRKLIGEMELSDRLYTLTNLTWSTTKEGTQLGMTVSRYVAPAKPVAKRLSIKPDDKSKTTPGAAPTASLPLKSGSNPASTQPAHPVASPGATTKP